MMIAVPLSFLVNSNLLLTVSLLISFLIFALTMHVRKLLLLYFIGELLSFVPKHFSQLGLLIVG